MEKNSCIVIVILVVAGAVIAEYDDSLACCPSSSFIFSPKNNTKSMICYDPVENTIAPMRLVCDNYLFLKNSSVKSGVIAIQLTDEFRVELSSDEACYGTIYNRHTLMSSELDLLIPALNKVGSNSSEGDYKNVSLLCINKEEEYINRYTILGYCYIMSIVSFGLTTIIYMILFELRDLFGKSVINFCGSSALGLGILAVNPSDMSACALRGFSTYYFLVASFFWSNSISIQLLRDTRRPSTEDYSWKEFRWYMLYSWGMPMILTMIMLIVNYHPGDHQKPGIGMKNCWFLSRSQEWYYLNSVVSILLAMNFAIFIYIAIMFWRFAVKSTHLKTMKFKLSMTIRLIVLMGLPWILKMISLASGGSSFTWYILELISGLQGTLVFLVLVVRKRVVRVLYQRGLLACCSGPVGRWLAAGEDKTNVVQTTDLFLREDNQRDEHEHE